ncbi:MAG: hypothetical protein GYB65_16975 [Chloroflexi bacterium]|nr:hypothetical protein [Chloroflexota bacterium]
MPSITTEWDNEQKTAIRVTYQPGWTWDDVEHNMTVELELLESVSHRVDVIEDFRGTRLPPGAVRQLPKIAESPPYTHPNSGLVIMVGDVTFLDKLVAIYKSVYGRAQKLHTQPDLDAARAFIEDHYTRQTQETPAARYGQDEDDGQ